LAQLNTITAGLAHQGFTTFDQYYQNGPDKTPYVLRDLRRHNLGNQFDDGLDLHISYALPTNFGSLDVGLDGTTFTGNKLQGFTGAPLTDSLAYNMSPYSFALHAGLTTGALTAKVTMNYLAGYSVSGIVNQTHVSAFQPINLYLGYDLDGLYPMLDGTAISLNITNLFDIDPPFYNTGNGTTNGTTLGRYFQIGLQKKF